MNYFIISAFGKDQSGIVAQTTSALAGLNCSIEDSSMTRLKNEFAMLLIVHGDNDLTTKIIEEKLTAVIKEKDLMVKIKKLEADQLITSNDSAAHASLNVYGADQIGIVAKTTALLARNNINISDLYTSLTPDNLFIMHFDLELPVDFDKVTFKSQLEQLKSEIAVEASFEIIEQIDL